MGEEVKSNSRPAMSHYDANYNNFETELYEQVRRDAFGEDIGQSSWLTADEQDRYLSSLNLSPGRSLLDVACGSGGPALRIAAKTGCSIVGIDLHDKAVATAKSLVSQRGLAGVCEFQIADAAGPLPFPDTRFDAITCIDAINHLPDRPRVISEWARLLKPGGRLLLTDPTTVTGPLTNAEIAVRSSIGFFLFVPHGYDEHTLVQCGLRVLVTEDVTCSMAELAERRKVARASKCDALREIEGKKAFESQQQFFEVAAHVATERRLSRFVYVAEKPL